LLPCQIAAALRHENTVAGAVALIEPPGLRARLIRHLYTP
jgi:hypothetical protein